MGFPPGEGGRGAKATNCNAWANINSVGPRVKESSSVQRYIAKYKIKLI